MLMISFCSYNHVENFFGSFLTIYSSLEIFFRIYCTLEIPLRLEQFQKFVFSMYYFL